MDDERIKQAVLGAIERSLDAHVLADVVRALARGPRPTLPETLNDTPPPTTAAKHLLTRIVLGDILDDAILAARPNDRTFPLRLFFGELGSMLARETEEEARDTHSDAAFTLASGLNFFFRARMDSESRMYVGLSTSRQFYAFADAYRIDAELRTKVAPLLAAMMSNELGRVRFESVDHLRVFDSQVHERAKEADPTAFNVVRPSSFLCRVTSNDTVKIKAEVIT